MKVKLNKYYLDGGQAISIEKPDSINTGDSFRIVEMSESQVQRFKAAMEICKEIQKELFEIFKNSEIQG